MIRSTLLAAAAVLSLGAGAAMAQSSMPAAVGAFVYDQSGTAIGSLKAVNGDQAVIWVGFYNTPGNHLETVSASRLASNGDHLVLNGAGPALASK